MRKTMIAIAIGLTALAAAACGNGGSSTAPLESVAPVASPSDMLESPSDMLESPSAS
ncbi:MAG: hypothetical protein ABIR11_11885 [Candidatus Limnocylindrales bacterium]